MRYLLPIFVIIFAKRVQCVVVFVRHDIRFAVRITTVIVYYDIIVVVVHVVVHTVKINRAIHTN